MMSDYSHIIDLQIARQDKFEEHAEFYRVYRKIVIVMWTYRCYDDGHQPSLWQRWYDQNSDIRGSHDAVFNALEQRTDWKEPWTKFFDKKHRIIEIRLNGTVKRRILGFYGPRRREFIVLCTCFHKQQVYVPPDVRKTAIKRKDEIEANPAKAIRCARPQ